MEMSSIISSEIMNFLFYGKFGPYCIDNLEETFVYLLPKLSNPLVTFRGGQSPTGAQINI